MQEFQFPMNNEHDQEAGRRVVVLPGGMSIRRVGLTRQLGVADSLDVEMGSKEDSCPILALRSIGDERRNSTS